MKEDFIIIKFRGQVQKISLEEVVFVEQDLRKVLFHLHSEICTTYGKLERYREYLPRKFYQCNKSYIINLDKVVKMGDQIIYFSDGEDIRIGRQSFHGAKKAFLQFSSPSDR